MSHHRRSVRLSDYDYAQDGAYFITICTFERQCIFGEVVNDETRLNSFGKIVHDEWLRTTTLRHEIELDVFVVMPNHFHAVLFINRVRHGGTEHSHAPLHLPGKLQRSSQSLGSLVAGFKAAVTSRINTMRNTPGIPVWQRNYYEQVIRSHPALDTIRQYILSNPSQWALDHENPVYMKRL